MDRRLNLIDTAWTAGLGYVLGLIATDGNLSPDGRHINITSKDREITSLIKKILKLKNRIGRKGRGYTKEKRYYVIQFGSKNFYAFLLNVGLTPAKSRTLHRVEVPDHCFPDFLRGCLDGDGNISESKHPESKHLQLRVRFTSASPLFLKWLAAEISRLIGTAGGHIYTDKRKRVGLLSYGKADSILLLRALYYDEKELFLKRKYRIARKYLGE